MNNAILTTWSCFITLSLELTIFYGTYGQMASHFHLENAWFEP